MLPGVKAPVSLRGRVLERVSRMERRAYTGKLTALIALAIASVSALIASCVYVFDAVSASGFLQYASLAFSDASVFAYSKDLGLSLVESLPALGVALVLSAGLVSVGSVWSFVRAVKERERVAVFA